MADFQLVNSQTVAKWSAKYSNEYIRESGLLPYMGTAETSIIRVRNELVDANGAIIHFPMVARLRGSGVTGSTALYGAEDTMTVSSDSVRTTLRRNAVMITEDQSYKTEIDLYNAARSTLLSWSAEKLRDDLLDAFSSTIVVGGTDTDGTVMEDSSALITATGSPAIANRNAHLVANTDRILVGGVKANIVSGVHATALALVNGTSGQGKLSAAVLLVAKGLAEKAGVGANTSHIRPYKTDDGKEYYVLFVSSEGYRDLSNDTAILAANTNARAREGDGMNSNPIFQGGDMIYQGIIIHKIPELTPAKTGGTGAGLAGRDICQAFLCGQMSVALAYSKKPEPRQESRDYKHRNGVAIIEIRGQKKVSFNGVQYGVVTLWHDNAPDA
jgi:hypothetical protein